MRVAVRVLLLLLACCAPARAVETPPSVVVVLVDTLRADYLGCYGFKGDVSPHIDSLCAQSVVFDQCFSQAPWTKPSIATLFTGLPPTAHQVLTHRGQYGSPDAEASAANKLTTDVLPGSAVTLAEALHQGGYATGAFVANPWIKSDFGFAQGFEVYEDHFAANGTAADVVIEAALSWLEHRDRAKPFFLYLHFMDVHDPYAAPEEHYQAIENSPSLGPPKTIPQGQLSKGMLRSLLLAHARWADAGRPERVQLRAWRGHYAAGIRAFDQRLAKLLDYLRSNELDRNSLFVLTSDHGEELFEHGDWAHGMKLFDHQLHVPLIVRLPGESPRGKRVKSLMGLIDVPQTILDFVGVKAPPIMGGQSYAGTLRGKGGDRAQSAVFATGVKWEPAMFSARTSRYKLIRDRSSGKEQLYDLKSDPGEHRDIAASQSETVKNLRTQIERDVERAKKIQLARPASVEIDNATKERLRALGYIE